MKKLLFKIGQRVDYILIDTIHFSGTIIEIDKNPKHKPYVILTDKGDTRYANEEFVKLSPLTNHI